MLHCHGTSNRSVRTYASTVQHVAQWPRPLPSSSIGVRHAATDPKRQPPPALHRTPQGAGGDPWVALPRPSPGPGPGPEATCRCRRRPARAHQHHSLHTGEPVAHNDPVCASRFVLASCMKRAQIARMLQRGRAGDSTCQPVQAGAGRQSLVGTRYTRPRLQCPACSVRGHELRRLPFLGFDTSV